MGLGAAMGMYFVVILASLLVWVILRWFDVIEARYIARGRRREGGDDQ